MSGDDIIRNLKDVVRDSYALMGSIINLTDEERKYIGEVDLLAKEKLEKTAEIVVSRILENASLLNELKASGVKGEEVRKIVKEVLEFTSTLDNEKGIEESSLKIAQVSSFALARDISLGTYVAMIGSIHSELLNMLNSEVDEKVLAISKAFLWFSSVAAESYHQAVLTSIKRSAGLPDNIIDRAIRISSAKVHERLE